MITLRAKSSSQSQEAQASAPGSLMLFGEHAVLHGHLGICLATDCRLAVRASRRTDGAVHLGSALGTRQTSIQAPDTSPPFQFVMTVVAGAAADFPGGLDLQIDSEFGADQGLGSSAAVTVATQAALDALTGVPRPMRNLQERCREVVRQVQGLGSGADLAASILGGVVAYWAEPLDMRRIADGLDVVVAYSGAKEKTAAVVARVNALRAKHPDAVAHIFKAMDAVSRQAASAISAQQLADLGPLFNIGQGLMDALGVNTPPLQELIQQLRATPGLLGAKISGSGLGDCVIALGVPEGIVPVALLPIRASGRGLEVRLAGSHPNGG